MVLTQEKVTQSFNKKEWQRGYDSQPNEYDYWIEDIEGQVPPELNGTLFRNGPGLLDIHGIPVRHPFDGDGMICAFSFQSGKVHFRNRFVKTEQFVKEQKAGKMLYRGVFGTQKPGGWLANIFDTQFKNIANTNVIYWGGKLLALWEAAQPHRLNPQTLDTEGLDPLEGILQPGEPFSAHPRIDPACSLDEGNPCLVNFSLKVGLSSTITVCEIAPQGKLLRRYQHTIPGFSFIHDFAITPNYCIFFQNPVGYNPIPFLLGLKGAGECVNFKANQPTRIIVIPRRPPHQDVKVFETSAGFIFHHGNAFEKDGQLCIDSICYDSLAQVDPDKSYKDINFEMLDPGRLWRFTLNLTETNAPVKREILETRSCEFPIVNPHKVGQPYRYVFLETTHNPTGNAPFQAILKLDLETGERQLCSFAPQGYVGEPIFVSKPNATEEDDGWVLTLVYNGHHHRSSLVILDGKNLNQGAVATLHLKHHIPYGLHGSWTSEYFL